MPTPRRPFGGPLLGLVTLGPLDADVILRRDTDDTEVTIGHIYVPGRMKAQDAVVELAAELRRLADTIERIR